MARERVQIKRTVGLVAMQEYGHGNDTDVGQHQGHDGQTPPGKIE
jgi:hypothetical protein